jgi:hypothetical protein
VLNSALIMAMFLYSLSVFRDTGVHPVRHMPTRIVVSIVAMIDRQLDRNFLL